MPINQTKTALIRGFRLANDKKTNGNAIAAPIEKKPDKLNALMACAPNWFAKFQSLITENSTHVATKTIHIQLENNPKSEPAE